MKGGKPDPAPSRGHAQILKVLNFIDVHLVPNNSDHRSTPMDKSHLVTVLAFLKETRNGVDF
jgi:hypothetical protein